MHTHNSYFWSPYEPNEQTHCFRDVAISVLEGLFSESTRIQTLQSERSSIKIERKYAKAADYEWLQRDEMIQLEEWIVAEAVFLHDNAL